ncbi:hypothetical protein D3C86_2062710 [compost metagenome]
MRGRIPIETAASICPGGTARKAERSTSVMKAPETKASAMMAAQKELNWKVSATRPKCFNRRSAPLATEK